MSQSWDGEHWLKMFGHQLNVRKLDGVGPVDNRPSTDKLHYFVKKNKNKKIVTCDT